MWEEGEMQSWNLPSLHWGEEHMKRLLTSQPSLLPSHQVAEVVAGLPHSTADCWSIAVAHSTGPSSVTTPKCLLCLLFLGTL